MPVAGEMPAATDVRAPRQTPSIDTPAGTSGAGCWGSCRPRAPDRPGCDRRPALPAGNRSPAAACGDRARTRAAPMQHCVQARPGTVPASAGPRPRTAAHASRRPRHRTAAGRPRAPDARVPASYATAGRRSGARTAVR
ncbi:hypothetical protein G6F66_014898 [Rhizopus arrhizus]|nr:hypothetical protein G6F66_014898 [Rhizopus arrhizus]